MALTADADVQMFSSDQKMQDDEIPQGGYHSLKQKSAGAPFLTPCAVWFLTMAIVSFDDAVLFWRNL
jgi:hypothetical protein